jgi:hypothetical protein
MERQSLKSPQPPFNKGGRGGISGWRVILGNAHHFGCGPAALYYCSAKSLNFVKRFSSIFIRVYPRSSASYYVFCLYALGEFMICVYLYYSVVKSLNFIKHPVKNFR